MIVNGHGSRQAQKIGLQHLVVGDTEQVIERLGFRQRPQAGQLLKVRNIGVASPATQRIVGTAYTGDDPVPGKDSGAHYR